MASARTNRLAGETSPYLLQHRHNPVDWHPWGEEALKRAREEDKPIFLSVGYSACHWCHVMERESFENEEIAQILNGHFVSIKVDREERPDVDAIYMEAVQLMTGQGGWPMSVFLLPDLRPFFGGTYFPPDDRWGRPGFKRLLLRLAEVYKSHRGDLDESASKLTEAIGQMDLAAASRDGLSREALSNAARELSQRFDPRWGGFGGAPKFPPSMALMLLLREWRRTGDKHLLDMTEFTLQRMALGGMYDQLGGGFHRYSVDERWLIPHFEKMLYDNALLARVYIEAHQATGSSFYSSIAADVLDYVLREMTSPGGGFYSAQDADSEGEEGKFFAWTPKEIEAVLGPEEGRVVSRFYGVTEEGNFEHGKSALHVPRHVAAFAEEEKIESEKLLGILQRARRALFEAREKRVKPGLDDKILASWNGLMIGAMALAGRVLERRDYVEAARRAADFVLGKMRGESGLLRTHRGGESRLNAYLDDYAFLLAGLLDLYEASFEPRWVREAVKLAGEMIERYRGADGAFFFTSKDHEALIVRKKSAQDGAIPSGNSMAALGLLRLGKLTGEERFAEAGEGAIRAFGEYLEKAPAAFHMMLVALDFRLDTPVEIAVVGDPAAPDTREALRAVDAQFVPNKVLAFLPARDGAEAEAAVPLLRGKTAPNGAATVYLCENFTCREPLTDPEAVRRALGGGKRE
ncbi:MAG: thioredoxin domain-containing protein [Candidatus Tectomicrobia bacterium]|uniref:Thioredoxin domain-containing protein n=1 Tax=Tectimicrobiota bacterium TaxID=2528274 RepID=A0A932I3L2_UNCTE|nr:thioredoxin domain-containing protein [Candidatus Tectomicrobia bacterium]